jgi:alpha-galactosidase
VKQTVDGEVWVRPLADGALAVALFSRSEVPAEVGITWRELGLRGGQPVRDLWRQTDLGVRQGGYSAELPRHGAVLLRVGQPRAGRRGGRIRGFAGRASH